MHCKLIINTDLHEIQNKIISNFKPQQLLKSYGFCLDHQPRTGHACVL